MRAPQPQLAAHGNFRHRRPRASRKCRSGTPQNARSISRSSETRSTCHIGTSACPGLGRAFDAAAVDRSQPDLQIASGSSDESRHRFRSKSRSATRRRRTRRDLMTSLNKTFTATLQKSPSKGPLDVRGDAWLGEVLRNPRPRESAGDSRRSSVPKFVHGAWRRHAQASYQCAAATGHPEGGGRPRHRPARRTPRRLKRLSVLPLDASRAERVMGGPSAHGIAAARRT
jgi:hypothetical protein